MKSRPSSDDLAECATQWLLRLQSPELTPAQEQQFFIWLKADPRHQQAYIEAEAHWQRLGGLESYREQKNASPVQRKTEQATATGRWHRQAIAASVILLTSLLLWQFVSGPGVETYHSEVGQQQHIRLADGSSIVLNTNSQLRAEPLSSSTLRVVYLDAGEALFNVQPDPQRPFIVYTHQGAVRVLGTQFSVFADNNNQNMLVTVVEGEVAIADVPADTDRLDAAALQDLNVHSTLRANQQLSIAQARQGIKAATVDAKSLTYWTEGKLIYNGVALSQVVKDLSRYFDGDIVLGDNSQGATVESNDVPADRTVVAVIELTDKASAIAAMESAFNVVAVNQGEALTVLYPK